MLFFYSVKLRVVLISNCLRCKTEIIPYEWLQYTFVTITKKPYTTNCKDHRFIILMSYVLKILLSHPGEIVWYSVIASEQEKLYLRLTYHCKDAEMSTKMHTLVLLNTVSHLTSSNILSYFVLTFPSYWVFTGGK